MSQNEGTTPRPVVYLHIGTMKSGTTNIQQRLQGNRSTVRSHGIYWASPWSQRQAKAVNELRRWSPGGAAPKLWDQVAAEMRAHPGTSILSMEFLFDATPQQIQYAVDSLSGAEIHVVVTLRDVQGWSSAQVCNLLGISETNQRVLLHRGRSRLRKVLEQYLADE